MNWECPASTGTRSSAINRDSTPEPISNSNMHGASRGAQLLNQFESVLNQLPYACPTLLPAGP